jgi:hypothetical protein
MMSRLQFAADKAKSHDEPDDLAADERISGVQIAEK